MEEALYDTPMFREFAGLDMGQDHLPDESTILRFRHLLEAHNLSVQVLATVNATLTAKGLLLRQGTVVDATLIAAPSLTKNKDGERDPRDAPDQEGQPVAFRDEGTRRPKPRTSSKPMRCCTARRPMSLPTPAIGVLRSVRKCRPNTLR